MKVYHEVKNVRFEGNNLILDIDGREMRFEFEKLSARLAKASDKERSAFEISPSGYGINWPIIDEDLSVDALLGIAHGPRIKRKTA
jgi:hypothetical protein